MVPRLGPTPQRMGGATFSVSPQDDRIPWQKPVDRDCKCAPLEGPLHTHAVYSRSRDLGLAAGRSPHGDENSGWAALKKFFEAETRWGKSWNHSCTLRKPARLVANSKGLVSCGRCLRPDCVFATGGAVSGHVVCSQGKRAPIQYPNTGEGDSLRKRAGETRREQAGAVGREVGLGREAERDAGGGKGGWGTNAGEHQHVHGTHNTVDRSDTAETHARTHKHDGQGGHGGHTHSHTHTHTQTHTRWHAL